MIFEPNKAHVRSSLKNPSQNLFENTSINGLLKLFALPPGEQIPGQRN